MTMEAAEWVALLIAGLGIFGTLAATLIAQRGEAKRAERTFSRDEARRAADGRGAVERERREALRSDYREVLRFVAGTRLFVAEMRARLNNLEWVTAHYSSDAREVEDLEVRAEMLRRRFLDDLPDIQALVGVWGSIDLVELFDDIDDFGIRIVAAISAGLHFKVSGERQDFAVEAGLSEIDRLLDLLDKARQIVQSDLQPAHGVNRPGFGGGPVS